MTEAASDLQARYQALVEAIGQREARLRAYETGEVDPRWRHFAYAVNFEWGNVGNVAVAFPVTAQPFVVHEGTAFHVEGVEAHYTIIGSTTETAQPAQIQVPGSNRGRAITFDFRVRDTAHEGEWSNDWIPGEVTLGGNERGLRFGRARRLLPGGTTVMVSVRATFVAALVDFNLTTATGHQLQFVFSGREVRA